MYLAHYTKRFIPEFDAECRVQIPLILNKLIFAYAKNKDLKCYTYYKV